MGTELLIAAALAAGSAGATAYNNNRVANKQDNIAAQGIRKQAENQRQTSARVNRTLDDIAASDASGVREQAKGTYIDQVQRQMGQAKQGLAIRGISDQYDEMAGAAQGDASSYAGTVADLMSRIDAGSLQRQAEGNRMGKLNMDLDVDRARVQGDAFLTDLLLKGVRRNPYIDIAAGAMRGAASGMMSGAGSGAGYTGSAGVQPYHAAGANSAWTSGYGGF